MRIYSRHSIQKPLPHVFYFLMWLYVIFMSNDSRTRACCRVIIAACSDFRSPSCMSQHFAPWHCKIFMTAHYHQWLRILVPAHILMMQRLHSFVFMTSQFNSWRHNVISSSFHLFHLSLSMRLSLSLSLFLGRRTIAMPALCNLAQAWQKFPSVSGVCVQNQQRRKQIGQHKDHENDQRL